MAFKAILNLFNTVLEKVPFFQVNLEKRKFDTQYAKEILELFNYQEFYKLTDNIFNVYFHQDESDKITELQNLIREKKFFNKKIQNKLEIFIKELDNFRSWSFSEFSTDLNSNRIKLDKETTRGQMMPNYSDNVKKCSSYANNLFEGYKQVYFEIQRKYPKAFEE